MEFILIIISLMILLVPGFDESVPPTGDKTFKIEYSDNVLSIKTISDQSLDFWGFDVKLKQNSSGILDIKIPKNFPTPASFSNAWNYSGTEPYVFEGGVEISFTTIEEPCYFHYKIPVKDMANLEIAYPLITAGTWQLYNPILFEENHPCYHKVFDIKKLNSPLKQIKSGVSLIDVKCNEGKVKIIKYNRMMVACVNGNTESETELIDRGWALLRFALPGMTITEINHSLCNNYEGKWHPEYEGCRDISDLQCSLMGGEFVDGLKICYDGICPVDKTYTLCVTNLALVSQELENEN